MEDEQIAELVGEFGKLFFMTICDAVYFANELRGSRKEEAVEMVKQKWTEFGRKLNG